MHRLGCVLALAATVAITSCTAAGPWPLWQKLILPLRSESVRFAVIADSGTGSRRQYEVANRMAEFHDRYPFTFVLMAGDNIYGTEEPEDFERKFSRPYHALLSKGVTFYAALGNHDLPTERDYEPFHMGGRRYYTFVRGIAQFFALDSNYMDPPQLEWLRTQLAASVAKWKICFFHHPLYSAGRRHGSEVDLRVLVEPLFIQYGVNVVFAGHEHFYERMRPEHGIHYFTVGGAAKLSRGDVGRAAPAAGALRATGYDQDRSFMLVEIAGDTFFFQTISRTGHTVDSGMIYRTQPTAAVSRAQRFALTGARPLARIGERPIRLEDGGDAFRDLRIADDHADLTARVELELP